MGRRNMAGVGLAVNDSIVAVPMVVALVVGPLMLVLWASVPVPVPATSPALPATHARRSGG